MTQYESEEIKRHLDSMGQVVRAGDKVAYATTRQIWVGDVVAIPEYVGSYETTVKISISTYTGPYSPRRKVTFDFIPQKIWRAESLSGIQAR